METVPVSVLTGLDWVDEDCIREAIESLARYARWRLTGEHGFFRLPPEERLDPTR